MPQRIKKEDHGSDTPLADIEDSEVTLADSSHTAQSPELVPSLGDNPGEHDFEPFPFMRLPLEIRNEVYSNLVIQSDPFSIGCFRTWPEGSVVTTAVSRPRWGGSDFPDMETRKRSFCNLTLTSREIYWELAPVFFTHNVFEFESLDCVPSFLSNLSPNSRRAIATIELWYIGKSPAAAFKALATCVGLRRLHILLLEYETMLLLPRRHLCLMKLRGLRDCLKLRGLTQVDVSLDEDDSDCFEFYCGDLTNFREALQILKQPHDRARLTRLDKKDYPTKLHRSIFGKANVKTRMENKVMGTTSQCG